MALLDKYLQEDDADQVNLDSISLENTSNKEILRVFNEYLKAPRFDGDACVVLTMPEATLKKYSEKLNAGIWWMYNKFKKKNFGMMAILVAIETMVDATKLASMLDMDIKLLVAKENGISATEADIERAAVMVDSPDLGIDEPMQLPSDYADKLTEDNPEEEAFILAGLDE